MPSFAKVQVMGHAGADPEQRFSQKGEPIVSFRLAVNAGRRQPDGTWSDETEWYRATCFGAIATRVVERVKKGDLVYVEGRLRAERWQASDGTPRTTLEVTANDVQGLTKHAEAVRAAPARAQRDELEDLPF